MPRKRISRIYWRGGRAWADLRDFADVGGGRERLAPKGGTAATTDPALAEQLLNVRVAQLEERRKQQQRLGLEAGTELERMAAEHLVQMKTSGRYSPSWLAYCHVALTRAVTFFDQVQPASGGLKGRKLPPGRRHLETITPPDVRAFTNWLRSPAVVDYERERRGPKVRARKLKPFGEGSVREHLFALSGVFATAISDGLIPMGTNPVANLKHKPAVPESTTQLLEVDEIALLLEAARTFQPANTGGRKPLACAYELLATYVLTGGRDAEVLGLDVTDLDFERNEILIRGTKTKGSVRYVPMHPQLREVLLPYVRRLGRIHGPLFASDRKPRRKLAAGENPPEFQRVTDWRGTLDQVAARAGFAPGSVRPRRFRVSYATHRCTCDGVSANEVRLEMGHTGSLSMLEKVYARAQRRSRRMGAVMEFRLNDLDRRKHADVLRRMEAA